MQINKTKAHALGKLQRIKPHLNSEQNYQQQFQQLYNYISSINDQQISKVEKVINHAIQCLSIKFKNSNNSKTMSNLDSQVQSEEKSIYDEVEEQHQVMSQYIINNDKKIAQLTNQETEVKAKIKERQYLRQFSAMIGQSYRLSLIANYQSKVKEVLQDLENYLQGLNQLQERKSDANQLREMQNNLKIFVNTIATSGSTLPQSQQQQQGSLFDIHDQTQVLKLANQLIMYSTNLIEKDIQQLDQFRNGLELEDKNYNLQFSQIDEISKELLIKLKKEFLSKFMQNDQRQRQVNQTQLQLIELWSKVNEKLKQQEPVIYEKVLANIKKEMLEIEQQGTLTALQQMNQNLTQQMNIQSKYLVEEHNLHQQKLQKDEEGKPDLQLIREDLKEKIKQFQTKIQLNIDSISKVQKQKINNGEFIYYQINKLLSDITMLLQEIPSLSEQVANASTETDLSKIESASFEPYGTLSDPVLFRDCLAPLTKKNLSSKNLKQLIFQGIYLSQDVKQREEEELQQFNSQEQMAMEIERFQELNQQSQESQQQYFQALKNLETETQTEIDFINLTQQYVKIYDEQPAQNCIEFVKLKNGLSLQQLVQQFKEQEFQ